MQRQIPLQETQSTQRLPVLKTTVGIPESSEKGCINGVSVVHVKVVPAAFSGKVVEPQSEYCVGPEKQRKTIKTSVWLSNYLKY